KARASSIGTLVDAITNIMTIKMFATQKFESKYLKNYLRDNIDEEQKLQWFMFKARFIQGLVTSMLIFFIVYYLIYLRSLNLISIGDFALILSLIVSVSDDIW